MFMHSLAAEWTKLRTTRSFWWTTGLVLVICFTFVVFVAGFTKLPDLPEGVDAKIMVEVLGMTPIMLTSVYTQIGLAVLLIQAIMLVTTEYRFGLVRQNFLATPQRWVVMLAKFVLYAVISAVIALVVVIGSLMIAKISLSGPLAEHFEVFGDEAVRLMWVLPLITVIGVLFVQGLGMLIRQTAGTVAITIILLLGFDQILRLIPKAGGHIANAMPFFNMSAFIKDTGYPGTELGSWSTLAVFAAWAVVVWGAGLIVTTRRDA